MNQGHVYCFSRQAGHRFGEHLERIIPLIVKYAKVNGDDELREYCIQVRGNGQLNSYTTGLSRFKSEIIWVFRQGSSMENGLNL